MVLLVQVLYWIWYRNSTPKFFREFAEIGVRITAKRDPVSFPRAIREPGNSDALTETRNALLN